MTVFHLNRSLDAATDDNSISADSARCLRGHTCYAVLASLPCSTTIIPSPYILRKPDQTWVPIAMSVLRRWHPSFTSLLCIRTVQFRTTSCMKYGSSYTFPFYATFLSPTLFHIYTLFYTYTPFCSKTSIDTKKHSKAIWHKTTVNLRFELVVTVFKVKFMSWSQACRNTFILNFI